MGAIAQLSTQSLEVEPGRSAAMAFTVRNTGTVVDRYAFQAVGAAAPWVSFSPDSLSLFPEASGTVNVSFSPPRASTVTAGPMPFGIKVISTEDPVGGVVEEGTLNVSAFSDITAELVPRVARGRRIAMTQLAVDNRSNCPYRAAISGGDPAKELMFKCNPVTIDVSPGAAVFARVRIRPRVTFWRGPTRSKPLTVTLKSPPVSAGPPAAATTGTPSGGPHPATISLDGSMMQESLLPSWIFLAVAAAVALMVLLVVLWFTVFKPTIRSTARHVARQQLQAAGVTPAGGSKTATTTPPLAGSGTSSASGAAGAAGAVTLNGTSQSSGNGTRTVYTVPSNHILEVTDLLVENTAGDTGTIAIADNGSILMEWSMANFRDLDYHWITPTAFGPGSHFQVIVSGCTDVCTPGIYYAGNLVKVAG